MSSEYGAQVRRAMAAETDAQVQIILAEAQVEADRRRTKYIKERIGQVKNEYSQKLSAFSQQKQIELSTNINNSRLHVLKRKEEVVQETLKKVSDLVEKTMSDDKRAVKIYEKLIKEVCEAIEEPVINIQCREKDVKHVKMAINNTKCDNVKINLDTERLPEETIGGVIATNEDGKIKVDNTFEKRILLAKDSLIPHIQKVLFKEADEVYFG